MSGIAAQLIATNGPSARGLSAWSARANSSLPVPLSPSSSTVASVCGGAVQLLRDLPQLRILADDARRAAPLRELLLQQDVLAEHAPLRDRALHHQDQMIGIDGLGEEVHRALLHRRDRVLDAAERGHDDDLQLRVELLGGAQHAKAVAGRQLEIGQDDGGTRLLEVLERFGLVARLEHEMSLRFQRVAEHRSQRVLVFDERTGKDMLD